jgi:hypothetical protein
MTIGFSSAGSWSQQQTNAASVVLGSHAPLIGDLIVSFCLTNNGLPSIVDSASDVWSSVYGPFGPTGGSRNYSLYMAYTPNVPTNAARTITWTGGASGQITANAVPISGAALLTPYDSAATPAVALGSGTSLLSNTTTTTSFPNAILLFVGSVDTASNGTYTAGNLGGSTGNVTASTGASGSAPNIETMYQVVSSTGTFSGACTYTVSAHWLAQIFVFTDTNNGGPPSLPLIGSCVM